MKPECDLQNLNEELSFIVYLLFKIHKVQRNVLSKKGKEVSLKKIHSHGTKTHEIVKVYTDNLSTCTAARV